MDYLVGAMITLIVYAIAQRVSQKAVESEQALTITYSQSHVYELMQPFLKLGPVIWPQEPRQTAEYFKNVYTNCLVVKNKAYWIKDNALYTAEVVQGQVQKETTQKVDTMTMSKVELNEMLFIVEKLREEKDDYRGSGK